MNCFLYSLRTEFCSFAPVRTPVFSLQAAGLLTYSLLPLSRGIIAEDMRNLIQQGLALREFLRERILILDGAMGTMLQQADLTADGFRRGASGGLQRESGDHAGRTWCSAIHRKYLDAGSDIIETNSFGSTPVVLAEYGLGTRATKSAAAPAELARKAADEFSTRENRALWPARWAPRRKPSASPAESPSTELRKNFFEQAKG